jgi:hypothetical protein
MIGVERRIVELRQKNAGKKRRHGVTFSRAARVADSASMGNINLSPPLMPTPTTTLTTLTENRGSSRKKDYSELYTVKRSNQSAPPAFHDHIRPLHDCSMTYTKS